MHLSCLLWSPRGHLRRVEIKVFSPPTGEIPLRGHMEGSGQSAFPHLPHLSPSKVSLWCRCFYYPYFTDWGRGSETLNNCSRVSRAGVWPQCWFTHWLHPMEGEQRQKWEAGAPSHQGRHGERELTHAACLGAERPTYPQTHHPKP